MTTYKESDFHCTKCADLEKRVKALREALEKYKSGSAFDFDRSLRGEVHFNSTLSQAVAREALAADDLVSGGVEK